MYRAVGSYTGMGLTPDGGRDGTFVYAYAATPGETTSAGRTDVVVRRSTDRRVTGTDPLAINDDTPDRQFTSFIRSSTWLPAAGQQ